LELFQLSPNPVKDQLVISIDNHLTGYLYIYRSDGKLVLSKKIYKRELTINVSPMTHGIYIARIISQMGMDQKIFIKQ